jgi:hypothetical protein
MSDSNEESISSTAESWSDDVELVLKNINHNCSILIKEHKKIFFYYNNLLKYFKIPLIVFSSVNSVFSVGLSSFVNQNIVSVVCCLISLICACISSIELFLQVHSNAEISLNAYRSYEILAVKISSTLKLSKQHREIHGLNFLNSVISDYNKIFTDSLVLINNIENVLIDLSNLETNNIVISNNPILNAEI